MLTPRLLMPLLLAACLASCTSAWQGASSTISAAITGMKAPAISREAVAALPYYQLLLEHGSGHDVMLLTRVTDTTLYWQTVNQASVILADGLVVRTTGMPADLQQTHINGSNPFALGLHTLKAGATFTRQLDLEGYRYGVEVQSTFHPGPLETITIVDEQHSLRRIDERVQAPQIRLDATNHYWIDDNGFIWKSRQTLWPGNTLTMTQLRPYGFIDL